MRRGRLRWSAWLVVAATIVVFGRGPLHDRLFGPPSLAPDASASGGGGSAGPRVGPCDVTRVVDGDTLHVRIAGSPTPDEKIRLLRINTPERDEPGCERATAALMALVAGGRVELEWEKPQAERDEYGRLLAYVWAGETLVNVELVRQGFTRFFTKYGTGRYADLFRAAEDEARTAKRGLWTDDGWNVGARSGRKSKGR